MNQSIEIKRIEELFPKGNKLRKLTIEDIKRFIPKGLPRLMREQERIEREQKKKEQIDLLTELIREASK